MPRPVFPVVRLPYDRPDRVGRVLDAIRREFSASRRPATAAAVAINSDAIAPPSMTAPREPEMMAGGGGAVSVAVVDQTAVDQITVGVRDCTLTPKMRPEIFVPAGGGTTATRNNAHDHDDQNSKFSSDGDVRPGPYLLVPPVNITAEISRPPMTPIQYYTS